MKQNLLKFYNNYVIEFTHLFALRMLHVRITSGPSVESQVPNFMAVTWDKTTKLIIFKIEVSQCLFVYSSCSHTKSSNRRSSERTRCSSWKRSDDNTSLNDRPNVSGENSNVGTTGRTAPMMCIEVVHVVLCIYYVVS